MQDKSYELFPGIRVTDAKNYSANSVKRLTTEKFKQFDRSLNGATLPTQLFMEKVAKHYVFFNAVCKCWVDTLTKEIIYIIMRNSSMTDTIKISFDEAAKNMGWKSFSFSKNEQIVIPVLKS